MKKGFAMPLCLSLLIFVNGLFLVLPKGRYDAIVVHHSASETGDLSALRKAHRKRGWFEIAYHLVMSNGRAGAAAGTLQPTWRYRLGLWSVATRSRDHNLGSLHLCLVGNYQERPVPAQLQTALGHALSELQKRYDIHDSRIFLHRDCSPTACPGRFIDTPSLLTWKQGANQADPDLQRANSAALNGSRPFAVAYGILWTVLNLILGWPLVSQIRGRFGADRAVSRSPLS